MPDGGGDAAKKKDDDVNGRDEEAAASGGSHAGALPVARSLVIEAVSSALAKGGQSRGGKGHGPNGTPAKRPAPGSSLHDSGKPGAAGSRCGPLAALLLLLVLFWFVLHRFGPRIAHRFAPAALRSAFEAAGLVGGVCAYFGAFCLAELLHIPGFFFVAAGVLVWGRLGGFVMAALAAPIASVLPFLVVRRIGGAGFLAELRIPLFKRIMERLDSRPLTTVLLLRACFFMAPPATYALALSGVSLRNYALGTFTGLLFPLSLMCLFTDKLLAYFGVAAAGEAVLSTVEGVVGLDRR